MFVGRERELSTMEALYASNSFEMLVIYGRRRVGKTALIEEFSRGKRTLSFTAQLQSDKDNLADFSRAVAEFYGLPESMPAFASWLDALAFIAQGASDGRTVLVLDEFPYACRSNAALPSTFQLAIDKHLKSANVMLVLCGSNQGFMEDEVLGEKSPLYGRRTAQLKLQPFDYLDAARMLPDCSPAEKISYYASLGGTPYYLEGIDPRKSYIENMAALFFSPMGRMFDEPAMLMRQELREPAVFISVMRAIANGTSKLSRIADAVGMPSSSLGFYLKTLVSLGLIERAVPFGEAERSKRGIYRICDPAFAFWFRFVAPYVSVIERGLGADVAKRLLSGDRRSEFEGHAFERVCAQWLVRQALDRKLPLDMTAIGSWWGADPVARQTTDIDVVAADEIDGKLLVGECKWRNSLNETETLSTLQDRCRLLPGYNAYERYLFTKVPCSEATQKKAQADPALHLVSVDQMFE